MTFEDKIGTVVTAVRVVWDSENLKKPYYEYGHPLEIFNILAKKSEAEEFKYDKYPLIALILDFDEDTNDARVIVEDFTIVIMTETNPNFEAKNRFTNTFTPTLIPLYDLFMEKLHDSVYFASDDLYQHTKRNRLYWGKEDEFGNSGNIGNDALDAVVISNLNLRLIKCN